MFFPVFGTTVVGSVFKGLRDFSEFNAKVQFWYKVSFFIVPVSILLLFAFFFKSKAKSNAWITFVVSYVKTFVLATGLLVGCLLLIDYMSVPFVMAGAIATSLFVFGIFGSRYPSVTWRLQLLLVLIVGFMGSLYILGHVMMSRSAGIGLESIRNSIVTQYVEMLFHVVWYAIFIGAIFYQQLYVLNKKRL